MFYTLSRLGFASSSYQLDHARKSIPYLEQGNNYCFKWVCQDSNHNYINPDTGRKYSKTFYQVKSRVGPTFIIIPG